MNQALSVLDAVIAKAEALKAKAAELGIGTGGEPLLLNKFAGRVAAIVAAWAATNIPGVAGFKDVLVALLTAALVETATDFIARSKVVPAWKAVTAAIAARRGDLNRTLDRFDAAVDSAQERIREGRSRIDDTF